MTADLIINFSGGKDSTVMLDKLCRKYPDHRKHVIFADTGWEHGAFDVTIRGRKLHVRNTEEWCRELVGQCYGLELHAVRSRTKTYLSMVEKRGRFPSSQYRQCTSDLKTGPIETWIRNNVENKLLIQCLGIRADESTARAAKKPFAWHEKLSAAGRQVFTWYPIFRMPTEDVYEYLKAADLPLHPVYRRAGGWLDRFSCRICIYHGGRDLAAIRKYDPIAFNLIAALEKKIAFTMRSDGTIVEAADDWERRHPEPETTHTIRYSRKEQQLCLW